MSVLLIIYLVSIVGAYLTFRQVYSAGGEWEVLNPGFSEFALIFVPILNSLIALAGIVGIVQDFILSLNIKIDYKRFFRIKK